jgi:hypothetical protein
MTAVEWLIQKLSEPVLNLSWYKDELYEKAKEMGKQQIIDAFKYAYLIGEDDISEDDAELEAKEYYDFYYGKKENNEN